MIDKSFDKKNMDQMKALAQKVAGVDVAFAKMKPELDNYYLIIMDSIYY